ncbi:MAG: lipoyl(octanoyl) transferase LipB [Phormidesmis sp.]
MNSLNRVTHLAPQSKPLSRKRESPRKREDSRKREGDVYLLGEVSYGTAWQWQRYLVEAYKATVKNAVSEPPDSPEMKDTLLLLEHPPVYTLGQGADAKFLRFDPSCTDYEIHRVERGGEVTHHCPGQLVGYPILNLRDYKLDLHWYLRQLEEVLIRTLVCYGLPAGRISGLTGVWVEGHKVAAIGIKVSQWITMHGFALNVCPNLSGFKKIVPCGIEGKPVGSMAQFLPTVVDFDSIYQTVIEQFEQVFDISLIVASSSSLADRYI